MSVEILNPFDHYQTLAGAPIDMGKLYVGVANLDPQTNPIAVFYDEALTIAAPQPLTTSGGYVWRSGAPARIFTASPVFSIKLLDKNNAQVFYSAESGGVGGDYTAPFAGAQQRTQASKNADTVNVFDFFTPAELVAYNSSPTTFDAGRPLQAFFDAIAATNARLAQCSGAFAIATGLTLGGASGCLTKNITGNLTLTALAPMDTMLVVQCGQDVCWSGVFAVIGTGATSYASRTCRVGVRFGGAYVSSRCIFTSVIARRFSQVGVSVNDLTTLSNFGDVRVSDCGSGYSGSDASLLADFSGRADTGSSGSNSQRTDVAVTVLPPATSETSVFVVIGGNIHIVTEVNTSTSRIKVFPWIDLPTTSGSLRYLFGAGVLTVGSDASVSAFDKIDAVRCSFAYLSTSLYAASVGNLVTQYNAVGMGIGVDSNAASVGGCVSAFYAENNDFDFARITRASLGLYIATEMAFNFAKVAYPCAPRLSTNELSKNFASLDTVSFNSTGQPISFEKYGSNTIASTIDIDVTSKKRLPLSIYANTRAFTLLSPKIELNTAFGWDSAFITAVGTGAKNAPTGTFTFNAPAGYTVNGLSTVSFTNFGTAATFVVQLHFATNNFLVSCAQNILTASATYDPPSLAAGAVQSTTVTLTGAIIGDYAACAFSRALSGTRMWAEVTAADTVTVYHQNPTASSVDLASGTLKVKIV